MRRTAWCTTAAVAAAAAIAVAGCGGGGKEADGGVAPGVDPDVVAAADAAGCDVAAYPAEYGPLAADGQGAAQPVPPVQGPHNTRWADWGVYDTAIPEPYVIHNMSHGGIVVRIGAGVGGDVRRALVDVWSADPELVLVEPGGPGVPADGVVVTTWLRAMRCPAATVDSAAALVAFRDAFRGHGLHPQLGDYPGAEPPPPDLPAPSRPDPEL